ncbi:MAG: HesB/IscA family protein [Actinomycetota bacterium]|nr:iron-sulfur cluster assembly accessory protein [Actinomycetota bacterium]
METTTATVPSATQTVTEPQTLALTDTAAAKVAQLLEAEGEPGYFLRVAVQPGGCSGLRYAIYFDDRELDGDVSAEYGSVTVRLDRMSAPYLKGAKLDWLESLEQSGFTIDNPNTQGTCACGDSFH